MATKKNILHRLRTVFSPVEKAAGVLLDKPVLIKTGTKPMMDLRQIRPDIQTVITLPAVWDDELKMYKIAGDVPSISGVVSVTGDVSVKTSGVNEVAVKTGGSGLAVSIVGTPTVQFATTQNVHVANPGYSPVPTRIPIFGSASIDNSTTPGGSWTKILNNCATRILASITMGSSSTSNWGVVSGATGYGKTFAYLVGGMNNHINIWHWTGEIWIVQGNGTDTWFYTEYRGADLV